MANASPYMTTAQAAETLAYTRQHISYLVRHGILDGEKFSRDVLVKTESVKKHLKLYHGKHRTPGRKVGAVVTKPKPNISAVITDGALTASRP